jgi:hypothetical protein
MHSPSNYQNRNFFPDWLNALLERENPPDSDHIVIVYTPKEYLDAGYNFLSKKDIRDIQ